MYLSHQSVPLQLLQISELCSDLYFLYCQIRQHELELDLFDESILLFVQHRIISALDIVLRDC
jgi:hypothetical protein